MIKILTLETLSLNDITPDNIKSDPAISALIAALDPQLHELTAAINQTALLYNLDTQPEPVLDMLAAQFHVDFYDLALNIEMKREAIKNSILWHMKKGTRWAILEALRLIGVDAEFIHWHDSGAQPYSFRIRANITGDYYRTIGRDKIISSIKRAVEESKAARSFFEGLETFINFSENVNLFAGIFPLLSGQEIINLQKDTPPKENKIFVGNVTGTFGEKIILPHRVRNLQGKIFSGFATIENIYEDIGVDLNLFQDLLLAHEQRIFDGLEKYKSETSTEIQTLRKELQLANEAQNKMITENFRKMIDLLRWKDESDEGISYD